MSHMARRKRDYIAPGLFGLAIGVNYLVHKTDWADTACMNGRRWMHTDTTEGKVAAVAGVLALGTWFVPHFIFGPLEND